MLHFQLKPVWKSSTLLGRSFIMNKNSQFTRIFFQAILEMHDTGALDIMSGKRFHQMNNQPKPKEKSLGYKKLAFLFAVLGSGTFISLLVAFFEFLAKLYLERQNSMTTINEQNSIDDQINKILDDLSNGEAEDALLRILQQRVKRINKMYVSNRQEEFFDLTSSPKF